MYVYVEDIPYFLLLYLRIYVIQLIEGTFVIRLCRYRDELAYLQFIGRYHVIMLSCK